MDRKSAILMSMAFEIVGIVVASVYIGQWIDQKFGWGGLGMAGMIMLGIAGWIMHFMIAVKDLDKLSDKDEKKSE